MAERFAQEGMRLMLADIEHAPLERAQAELRAVAPDVRALRVDVTDPAQVEALAAESYRAFGAVHILCNNAGVISPGAPSWEESLETWHWVMDVNLWGVVHGIRSFVPRMLRGGEEGHIINTASLAGLTTRALMSAYNASKHAVIGLSEALYSELKLSSDKLQVSVLCPGFAKTRLAESTRNRPGGDTGQTTSYGFHDALKTVVEEGTPAADIADCVLDGVRNERFWIMPSSRTESVVRERTECILEGRNPPVHDLRPQPTKLW